MSTSNTRRNLNRRTDSAVRSEKVEYMRKALAVALGAGIVATAIVANAQMMPGGRQMTMQMDAGEHGPMHMSMRGRIAEHAEMRGHANMEQDHPHMGAGEAAGERMAALPPAATTPASVQGEVVRIDPENGRITLRHEAIPNLDMRAMTMVFKVDSPSLLDGVKVGDRVTFAAERVGGAITLTKLEKATAAN
jgi:Cu(I)/Ag(I) efflux system protein CusF